MGLNSEYTTVIPVEVVNMVIDYIDYDKFYKIEHKNGPFQNVLADFIDMSYIFPTTDNIRPSVSSFCWGKNNVGNIFDTVDINEMNSWDEIGVMDWDDETPEWA